MKFRALALLVWLSATTGRAASIGLFADSECMICSATLALGQDAQLFICVNTIPNPWGPSTEPVDSGEFRIIGVPPGWLAATVREPIIAAALGDALGDGLVFALNPPTYGMFHIFKLYVHATTSEQNVVLRVVRPVVPHPPWGYPTTCPWLHYDCGGACDQSGSCADGGMLVINGACDIAVKRQSWGGVQQLYR